MPKDSSLRKFEAVELTPALIGRLSAAALKIAQNDSSVNVRDLINAELLKRQKAKVRYANGVTLPASAEILLLNSTRKDYNHRRTLSRNLVAASKRGRPADVCAHHIVAANDPAADPSKVLPSDGASESTTPTTASSCRRGKPEWPAIPPP